MLNAAVWLGATIFCSTAVLAALNSRDLVNLIGAKYFAQVSGAIVQIIFARLFQLQIACALLAWLHLIGEWLYLGRYPQRGRMALLVGLLALSLAGAAWLGPKLTQLHRARYGVNAQPETRTAAERSFRRWNGVVQAVNAAMIGGVLVYFWRVTRPEDSPRFVRPVNFRS